MTDTTKKNPEGIPGIFITCILYLQKKKKYKERKKKKKNVKVVFV